ncbi:GNAT family N-acetyltransferase [Acidisoma silvae]|uniref:GNAT family N-acetyltransferase n=1 Tax=Acidisoma silvae TaxID=2802396 RepID=A0A964E0I1_9PROT|nr:GNAT family N-acetyltransferase [Acidisoma silvae]MCB8877184.1 GNAT family N-acetyltransferase [Acidisoma silvae]
MRLDHLPALATKRLALRPLVLADADAFRAMTDHPAVTAAVHFLASPFTLAAAEGLIAGDGDGRDCFWGVWRQGGNDLLGTIGTHLRGTAEIEIGYWFAPASQGQGIATEAAGAILAALHDAYPDCIVYAECRPDNEPSWRLLQRLGFRHHGVAGARPGRARLVLL